METDLICSPEQHDSFAIPPVKARDSSLQNFGLYCSPLEYCTVVYCLYYTVLYTTDGTDGTDGMCSVGGAATQSALIAD